MRRFAPRDAADFHAEPIPASLVPPYRPRHGDRRSAHRRRSHGGSSKQARSAVDGLEADIITMYQANDIDVLHDRGKLIPADRAKRPPDNASPTTSTSVIPTENPVSFVDKRGARKATEAGLKYLRSDEGQELAATHSLRPRPAKVLAKYTKQFPKLQLFTVDELFGGWKKAQKEHFDDGGLYDQIVASAKR